MTAWYNEIDPYAAQWLRNLIAAGHIAPGDVDERSILDVRPDDLAGYTQCHFFAGIGVWSAALRAAEWPDDRPVWTGSCPCQPFSQAGRGGGFDDERHLWPAWSWLVGRCRPDVVLGEQVAEPDGLAWLDLVSTDLEGMGYACGAVVFPAAGVGAPQGRHRTYWLADAGRPRMRRNAGAIPEPKASSRSGGIENGGVADEPGARGNAGDVGSAGGAGLALGSVSPVLGRHLRFEGAALGAAEPLRGFWSGADWLWHRDGFYRPVEPGTFPLADGPAGRVGQLRAYGNAIVLPAAQAFVEAAIETLADGRGVRLNEGVFG